MAKEKEPIYTKKQWIGLFLFIVLMFCIRYFFYRFPKQGTVISENEPDFQPYAADTFVLHPFDPNTADSITLSQLGLCPYQVHRLLRYRNKGGRFYTNSSFQQFLNLPDSTYSIFSSYVTIDTIPFHEQRLARLQRDSLRRDSLRRVYASRRDSIHLVRQQRYDSLMLSYGGHIKRDTILELNIADTSDLQFIHGIGINVARAIVREREQLGGYYSLDQLREISSIAFVEWDSIFPHLTVDTMLIRPIPVQTASLRQLTRHPYINFDQAKDIYEMRRRLFHVSPAHLCPAVFSYEEWGRVRPYLDFTIPDKSH